MLEFNACRHDCELSGGFCAMAIAIVFRGGDVSKSGFAARNAAAGAFVEQLKEHLRAGLPDYMISSGLVMLERMPLTSSGKFDRKALPVPPASFGAEAKLEQRYPVVARAIDQCASILEPLLGLDLRNVLFGDPWEAGPRLEATALAQSALFSVSLSVAALWRSLGFEPAATLGHSIGEFVAATLAGVMRLEDALSVVVVAMRGSRNNPKRQTAKQRSGPTSRHCSNIFRASTSPTRRPAQVSSNLASNSLFVTQRSQSIKTRFNVAVSFRQMMGELGTVDAVAGHLDRMAENFVVEAPSRAEPNRG